VKLTTHLHTPLWRGAQLKKESTGTTLPLPAYVQLIDKSVDMYFIKYVHK
jgi:hypothetical protein